MLAETQDKPKSIDLPATIHIVWKGPKAELLGNQTILWIWETEELDYKVLRVHPPYFPVQYGISGRRGECSCAYVPDLNAALLSCERDYRRNYGQNHGQNLPKEVLVVSNRDQMVWQERKDLANLAGNTERDERIFYPGQPVPISWFPICSYFAYRGWDGKEGVGRVIGINPDWTMEVSMGSYLEALPMDFLVSVQQPKLLRRRSRMEIQERDARDLFVALGFKAADDEKVWPDKRLLGRLNRMPEWSKEIDELADERLRTLATGVCKALSDGVSIELIGLTRGTSPNGFSGGTNRDGSQAMEEEMTTAVAEKQTGTTTSGPSGPKTRGRKPKVKQEGSDGRKAAKEKKPKDEYGCLVGSENAKLNMALSKDKPKTMQELVQEAGLKRGLYGHIKAMMKKGHVKEIKETKEGEGEKTLYALTH